MNLEARYRANCREIIEKYGDGEESILAAKLEAEENAYENACDMEGDRQRDRALENE